MPKTKKLNIICGTPSYMVFVLYEILKIVQAPELISKEHYNGFSTDCWALGIVLYAMIVGKFPFKGFNEKELYKSIKLGKLYFPNEMSEQAKELIKNLLTTNLAARYSTT